MSRFHVGQTVFVKMYRRRARIKRLYSPPTGGVELDRAIDGYRYWNVDQLRPLTKREAGPR